MRPSRDTDPSDGKPGEGDARAPESVSRPSDRADGAPDRRGDGEPGPAPRADPQSTQPGYRAAPPGRPPAGGTHHRELEQAGRVWWGRGPAGAPAPPGRRRRDRSRRRASG